MEYLSLIISTLNFLCGFILAVVALRSGRKVPAWLNILIVVFGLIFQMVFLNERGALHGRCPITNGPEVLVFVSWSVILMYLALGKAFRLSLLGTFTVPLVFIFQAIALIGLFLSDPGARPPEKLDPWLELHAAMSLLAYGAFGLAAIAGVMYLVQDRQLKSREIGSLFYSMPPIKYLTDSIFRLLVIGTVMLTIGVVAAFFMDNLPDALHLGVSGAVWLVYLSLISTHLTRGLAPKTFALAAMVAFAFALVTLAAL